MQKRLGLLPSEPELGNRAAIGWRPNIATDIFGAEPPVKLLSAEIGFENPKIEALT